MDGTHAKHVALRLIGMLPKIIEEDDKETLMRREAARAKFAAEGRALAAAGSTEDETRDLNEAVANEWPILEWETWTAGRDEGFVRLAGTRARRKGKVLVQFPGSHVKLYDLRPLGVYRATMNTETGELKVTLRDDIAVTFEVLLMDGRPRLISGIGSGMKMFVNNPFAKK